MYITNHHQAHAANTFYTSPFEDALIITIDGGGVDYKDGREYSWGDLDSWPNSDGVVTATTFWKGEGNKITPIEIIDRSKKNVEKIDYYLNRLFKLYNIWMQIFLYL